MVSGNRKLDKSKTIAGKHLFSELRSLMTALLPGPLFSSPPAFPEDTPGSLKHGFRFMAEQAAFYRTQVKKRKAPSNNPKATIKVLLSMMKPANFETLMKSKTSKEDCIESAEELLGIAAAEHLAEDGDDDDADWNAAKKKK